MTETPNQKIWLGICREASSQSDILAAEENANASVGDECGQFDDDWYRVCIATYEFMQEQ